LNGQSPERVPFSFAPKRPWTKLKPGPAPGKAPDPRPNPLRAEEEEGTSLLKKIPIHSESKPKVPEKDRPDCVLDKKVEMDKEMAAPRAIMNTKDELSGTAPKTGLAWAQARAWDDILQKPYDSDLNISVMDERVLRKRRDDLLELHRQLAASRLKNVGLNDIKPLNIFSTADKKKNTVANLGDFELGHV
jgi:hypothetical protein